MKFKFLRLLCLVLSVAMVFTLTPAGIFAATNLSLNESYNNGLTTDLCGWYVNGDEPTHAVLEKVADGVNIRQTVQTPYASDGTTKNGSIDGSFRKDVNVVIDSDENSGTKIFTKGAYGNVTITMDLVVSNGYEGNYLSLFKTGNGSAYYTLVVDGYLTVRLFNQKAVVLNTSSINNNTMTVADLTTSNGDGETKQLVVNIDTTEQSGDKTVSVSLDGGDVSTGASVNYMAGKTPAGAVKTITAKNMERMNVGGYLKFQSLNVESDIGDFDADTLAKIEAFKSNGVSDADNVTENLTLPTHIDGLMWSTSDSSVMTKAGKIARSFDTDNTAVVISTTFDGKTTSGLTVPIMVEYALNVTGKTSRSENTTIINPVEGADQTTEKYYTMPQRGNEEDGYPMFDDPNYITDEAFFGVWDSSTASWSEQPYFRYDEYPAMSAVEAAVKVGDYETAKNELVTYYRSVADNRAAAVTAISTANRQTYNALYQLMSRNAYVTNFISNFVIDTFSIGKTFDDTKIDVTNMLNNAKGSYSIFTTVVASVDKYRNQAEVYSRESDFQPYITANVNGETKTFTATKDATLQAGAYGDINFGSDEILYAEEAGSWGNFEDRTKRMFIGFDVSSLKRTDTITDAYIVLKARHTGSDDQKLMAAYWIGESSWLENKVCWNTFADHMYFSCNDMYCWDWVTSNKTTIKGKVCGYHRDTEPSTLATSYSFYSQHPELEAYPEKYAYTYLRQYMGLINSLGVEPDVMNQLDMSCHITGVSRDIMRLMDSKYMTGEVLTAYLKHLWLLTEYHIYNYYGKAKNNYATFSTGAVYNMCARYPEFERHDLWTEKTVAENEIVFEYFTFDDGMCYELSHNYHSTLLGTFDTPFSVHQHTGEPLPYSEKTTDIIYDIVISLFNQSGPYGGFNQGDGYDPYTSYKNTFKTWYENLFANDPTISYVATGGAAGYLPESPSTNYPIGQRSFLRSGWGTNDLMLAMTNKMVGSHGHKDALSIAMFAYGKYLLTDQGYGSVQTGNTMYYMKSPQQHNTVTVNDNSDYLVDGYIIDDVMESYNTVKTVDGVQMDFDSNNKFDFVEYSTPAYTTTTNSQRSVTMDKINKFWIVTDYHIPNDTSAQNVFTQNWHLYPGANMTIDSTTKIIESHFQNEPNVMVVPVDYGAIEKTEIRGTWYSEKGGQINDSQKAMYYKTKSGNGVFGTIILPTDVGDDYSVSTTKLTNEISDEECNLFAFTITDNNSGEVSNFWFYHLNNPSLATTVTVGSYTTDANTLLVEEDADGSLRSLYMVDGSFVKKGNTTIAATADGTTTDLGFAIEGENIDVHTMNGYSDDGETILYLKNCLINSGIATTVSYDGTENIPYTVTDGMMTFTEVESSKDEGLGVDPFAGTLIFDSDVNPEGVEIFKGSASWYSVSDPGDDGKVVSIKHLASSIPTSISQPCILHFNRIQKDDESQTVTKTDMMSGKYAIDLTLMHNTTTERLNNSGEPWPTYVTMELGVAGNNSAGELTSGFSTFVEFRLMNTSSSIIRYASTQADGVRKDINGLAGQTLAPDTPWKIRIAVDTVAKTYTVFVNDNIVGAAMDFPYNLNSNGDFLPDLRFSVMSATNEDCYFNVENVKIYQLEEDESNSYINKLNSLPKLLCTGNPGLVTGSLVIPSIDGVSWSVTDNEYMGVDGVINGKVSSSTPITFTASYSGTETGTSRVIDFTKTYDMTLVPNTWLLNATNSGDSVTVSASNTAGDYSVGSPLIIAGYNKDGAICDIKVVKLTQELVDYTYTLSENPEVIKVFILESFDTSKPLVNHLRFD